MPKSDLAAVLISLPLERDIQGLRAGLELESFPNYSRLLFRYLLINRLSEPQYLPRLIKEGHPLALQLKHS